MIRFATLTAPEMIGLLAWWCVVLAAPVILVRRWRRRTGHRRPEWSARLQHSARTGGPTDTPNGEETVASASTTGPESAAEATDAQRSEPALATAASGAGRSRPPRSAARGLPSGTLEPLCRYVDFQRRLELAARELRARLAQLPASRWRIEPYPLTGERRNTVLLLGETGVFVISATYAPGHWDDVIAASTLARKVQLLLPGYPDQVQPAICHPFTAGRPRLWHRPDEHGDWVGAWVLGGDSAIEWVEHFGIEHGLGPADLARFDELVKPNWLKPAIPTPPSWPPIPEAAPPGTTP